MIDFSKIIKLLKAHNSFLITTHINPDGDAIGSELALYQLLHLMGKTSDIINHNETPENLKFMDPGNVIRVINKDVKSVNAQKYDAIIVLDLNQLSRTGDLQQEIINSGKPIFCIDHHQNPDKFTEYLFVDESYGSTGELVFELIEQSGTSMNYEMALPLYVAIVTDTGSFKYERTKPSTHLKAAKLLEQGIDPKKIHSQIYDQGKLNTVKLLARALNSIEVFYSGRIAVMKITRKDLEETGTKESDMEFFVNNTLAIGGVIIGIFMYELENGVKVSFRSVGTLPVNKLAAEFGGGGHVNAAATRIKDETLQNVFEQILIAAEKYLNESEAYNVL